VKQLTLKAARKRRRLTQAQLAAVTGLGQGYISRLENGIIADPAFSIVRKLAHALELDPRQLDFSKRADEAVA
jgi:transcriptional regulator with XRE-family HTH domain